MCPGNHDAVRVADPQPAIIDELLGDITKMENVYSVGSPCYFSLHGVEVLMYHGASIHSIVPHIPRMSYDHPEKVAEEYLKRRHLHPVYGERPPITPEKKDYLVIEKVPDIMHLGDVHKNGYLNYKGVVAINSGTWQNTTPYQIRLGHHPTPCILPVVNLHNTKLTVIHFDKPTGG